MTSLDISDLHILRAAEGWMELRNFPEAEHELKSVAPEKQRHPDVLEFWFRLRAEQQDWDACREVAQTLTKLDPSRPAGWLHLAYATRRATKGGIQAAWDILLPAAERFPTETTILYNLACYACQMGRLDEARQWLRKAIDVGGAKEIKQMALADADLEPLRQEIPKM